MKSFVFVALFAAAAFAAPQAPPEPVPIVRQDSQINGDGSNQYSIEIGNGISTQQQGNLKDVGDASEVIRINQDRSEDRTNIQLSLIADETGFQPQGLPTAPSVPQPISSVDINYLL